MLAEKYFLVRISLICRRSNEDASALRCSSQPQELAVAGVGTRGNTKCGMASFRIDSCYRNLDKR